MAEIQIIPIQLWIISKHYISNMSVPPIEFPGTVIPVNARQ